MVDIRNEREQVGLTQNQLARMAGVAPSNLSAIESGRRRPSPQMVERLRAAMRRPSTALAEHREEVMELIGRHGGTSPQVFGSVAKGRDVPGSDLDILVSVKPEDAWRFASLRPALIALLGVDVDVVPVSGLKEKHRRILEEAVPL
ncbi:MAG: XRE family transcriptional regulator [Micrococcales bacterium]|nr:XRE family transcriptional regulator [Micrococcales bacterium]